MTFPVLESASTVATANSTAGTSHNVNLPATVNAGDLLIAVFQTSLPASATTVTWDNSTAGVWSNLYDLDTSSLDSHQTCKYKIADGTEDSATLVLTTSQSVGSEAVVFRVSGWHGTTPPEVATVNTINGVSHDPPSLTPSWGAADTLWLALAGEEGATRSYSAFPTSYTNTRSDQTGSGSGGVIGSAWRSLNAASEDPATFTSSASNRCITATIAIRPAAGGGSILRQMLAHH